MPRKETPTIKVSAMNLADIKQVILNADTASFQERIAAIYELDSLVTQLKSLRDDMTSKLENTPLTEIQKAFEDAGLCSDGELPRIEIGGKYTIKLSEKIKTNFAADTKKLSELGDLVPEKYRKITTTIDKGALEKDYEEGSLDSLLKPYVSTNPTTVTVMSRSTIKEVETDS